MTRIPELFDSMEYGPALESASESWSWLEGHDQRFGHFIHGEWQRPARGERFVTSNPATDEELATVAQGSAAEVDDAVAAARRALGPWRKLGGHGRARYLHGLARLIQKHARELAVIETLDSGTPIRKVADSDLTRAARHFQHHAGWAHLIQRELPGYREIGVIGQIIPWSLPFLTLAWKVAPALAAGNTVVLKPAVQTPLSALRFADLVRYVGLPPGVFNLVTGDGATGAAIVEHPGVDMIAFTGSTEVGRGIRSATAGSGKHLSLSLPGKSPLIVFDDADLDSVVEGVVDASWSDLGQVGGAGARILVQESTKDALLGRLRQRMATLRVGDPLDRAIDIGAIGSAGQLAKIEQMVREGVEQGGACWQPEWERPPHGSFFPPTLFTDAPPDFMLTHEQIAGPVAVVQSFRTPNEAVELANHTRYGQGASIWSESVSLSLDLARRVRAGTAWINCTHLFDAASGFGGYREGGFGREGGREGMYEYLRAEWEGSLKEVDGRWRETRETLVEPLAERAATRSAGVYLGGAEKPPAGSARIRVASARGGAVGEVGQGSAKDVHDAVEAAHAGLSAWAGRIGRDRAHSLYALAEGIEAGRAAMAERIVHLVGSRKATAEREVDLSVRRLYSYAAWADQWEGSVHRNSPRGLTISIPEPIGVLGIVCPDEAPLLGFISTVIPAIAMGNAVVAVPSERYPLVATDLYPVLATSALDPGVINIVPGERDVLAEALASHDDVDGIWYFGDRSGSEAVERLSAGNLKRSWVNGGRNLDWRDERMAEGEHFLRRATEGKSIWIPHGE